MRLCWPRLRASFTARPGWIAAPGSLPTGLIARLQAGSVVKKAQARVSQALAEVSALHAQVTRWLTWVHGRRWSQADLLQVMEELEPQATAALKAYFILRAGLLPAADQVAKLLAAWLPDRPADATWGLYVGLEGMPGVEAAYTVAVAARDEPSNAAALAHFGHRGPDEMRPDGERWGDEPELMADLALHRPARNHDTARMQRQMVEAWVFSQLGEAQARQFEAALRAVQDLARAVDVAWDAVTMVMAVAQAWLQAAAQEARTTGLVAAPSDTLYMRLEELKQVATGERHRGHSAEVRAELSRRRTQAASPGREVAEAQPAAASPGQAQRPGLSGLTHGDAAAARRHLGGRARRSRLRRVLVERRRPGGRGQRSVVAGRDRGRSLGVPVVVGAGAALAAAQPGQMLAVDGDTGRIERL